jgi:hypothetical protein
VSHRHVSKDNDSTTDVYLFNINVTTYVHKMSSRTRGSSNGRTGTGVFIARRVVIKWRQRRANRNQSICFLGLRLVPFPVIACVTEQQQEIWQGKSLEKMSHLHLKPPTPSDHGDSSNCYSLLLPRIHRGSSNCFLVLTHTTQRQFELRTVTLSPYHTYTEAVQTIFPSTTDILNMPSKLHLKLK